MQISDVPKQLHLLVTPIQVAVPPSVKAVICPFHHQQQAMLRHHLCKMRALHQRVSPRLLQEQQAGKGHMSHHMHNKSNMLGPKMMPLCSTGRAYECATVCTLDRY